MIQVHADKVYRFAGTRFSTEENFNNLCIWDNADLLAVFADGKWVAVEFVDE